jgi:uncharacterized protein YkwD
MKTTIASKTTLALLAAATLLFTGCNPSDAEGITPNSSSNVNTHTTTPAVKPANVQNVSEQNARQDDESADEIVSKIPDDLKQEYLDAINAARAETQDCGEMGVFDPAPALTWDDRLGNAAYEHSNDMAQSDTFSHTGSGTASDITAVEQDLGRGSKFRERIENNGYVGFRAIGENIAAGYESAQEVVEAWLASDHHCANLMNPKFTEVGMAKVEKSGTEYGSYWTQEFGTQK